MLAVVPNVVKINRAREVERWTPQRRVTVIHGDGKRRRRPSRTSSSSTTRSSTATSAGLSSFGFRSMVVDEAHFIKNLQSQRSQQVLALGDRLRETTPGGDPLLIALTGTPLINDVKDFDAIWRFLGWIKDGKPTAPTCVASTTPATPPPTAPSTRRPGRAVIDMGSCAAARSTSPRTCPTSASPTSPSSSTTTSAARSASRAGARPPPRPALPHPARRRRRPRGGRRARCRPHAPRGRRRAAGSLGGEGHRQRLLPRAPHRQAKATLAADYAAQLSHSVGKVVLLRQAHRRHGRRRAGAGLAGLRTVSVRGEQTSKQRQEAIDAFQKDPEVAVAVCSLTAAGVGLNLHAASNVVLAELSWTAAEQQQAIDRVHRIGQDEPVTAWRILASGTIDSKIAELIDAKQGLAARALDGSDEDISSGDTLQLDASSSCSGGPSPRSDAPDHSRSVRIRDPGPGSSPRERGTYGPTCPVAPAWTGRVPQSRVPRRSHERHHARDRLPRPGQKAWQEVPKPTVQADTDAVVRVDTVTICGTDLHILKGDVAAVTDGRILGHEAVGTVEEVGPGVKNVRPGDRVLVSCITACGACRYCRDGSYGQCIAWRLDPGAQDRRHAGGVRPGPLRGHVDVRRPRRCD